MPSKLFYVDDMAAGHKRLTGRPVIVLALLKQVASEGLGSLTTKEYSIQQSKDGTVVRVLASHQCGLGSNPRLGVK